MNEKRKFARFKCAIKCNMDYYEGDPDLIGDVADMPSIRIRGSMLDISRGGVLVTSNVSVAVTMPMHLAFMIGKEKNERFGKIVRTGLLRDNPSEVARKIAVGFKGRESYYIAIEFDDIMHSLSEHDL
ncbi:MAG: hypothetical protein FWG13_02610 [Leptospirales bacterium]|nr:hypothetical protein [Leptospirales bacterium]